MKKLIAVFLYGVAAIAVFTFLIGYGSTYDYKFIADFGGGTPLYELFPAQEPESAAPNTQDPSAPIIIVPDIPLPPTPEPPEPALPGAELPELPLPSDLQHNTVYRFIDGMGNVYAAVFDLEAATARFYVTDVFGVEYISILCMFKGYDKNTLTVVADYNGETINFCVAVDFYSVESESVRLNEILGIINPINPGTLTLYADIL